MEKRILKLDQVRLGHKGEMLSGLEVARFYKLQPEKAWAEVEGEFLHIKQEGRTPLTFFKWEEVK